MINPTPSHLANILRYRWDIAIPALFTVGLVIGWTLMGCILHA